MLIETALALKKALEIAQGMETALQDVHEMQGNPQAEPVQSPEEVHAVSNKKNTFVCYRCGQNGHRPAHCSFRSAQCHKCEKLGHIKRMYQSKKALRSEGTSNTRNNRPTQTESKNSKAIRNVQNEITTETEYPLHNINSPATTKPLMVDLIINDQPVSMELDTGSAVTLVSEHT